MLNLFGPSTFLTTVSRTSYVTPRMRRITLTHPAISTFGVKHPGQFVKITIPRDSRRHTRAFTIRNFSPQQASLDLEFAIHGDTPICSAWAMAAHEGQTLEISKPGRGYHLNPDVPNHVLAGDPTFLPAANELLARIPAGANVFTYFEVQDGSEEQDLKTEGNLKSAWVHSGADKASTGDGLIDLLSSEPFPLSACAFWVGCESHALDRIKKLLLARGAKRLSINAHGYWKSA